jgi:hypothetical protein
MIGSEQLWKRGITLAAAVALAGFATFGLAGCAGDDEEGARSITSIASINDNLPLAADVYNNGADKKLGGGDDYIPEDYIKLVVKSRPHDPALTLRPDRAFGTVRFHTYSLDFATNDFNNNGTVELTDFINYPMNLVVPINSEGTGFVLAVPGSWKTQNDLLPLFADGSYFTTATITLIGEEETSHEEVVLTGGLVVGISNYADQTN